VTVDTNCELKEKKLGYCSDYGPYSNNTNGPVVYWPPIEDTGGGGRYSNGEDSRLVMRGS
jgi:hypothetical protein